MSVAIQRIHENPPRGIMPRLQVTCMFELLLDGAMRRMGRVVVGMNLSDVYEEKMDLVGVILCQLVD